MTTPFKLGAVAAAVILASVVGISILPGIATPGVGAAASATPGSTPIASPTARTESLPVSFRPLEAGRYHIDVTLHDFTAREAAPGTSAPLAAEARGPGGVARVTFDVPDGWVGYDDWAIIKDDAGAPGELAMAPMTIESIFLNPCYWSDSTQRRDPSDWDRGRTMAGLADGLWMSWASNNGPGGSSPRATKPTAVDLAGRDSRYVEVQTPADFDMAACDEGQYTLWEDVFGGQRYVDRAGELDRLWIIDVEGTEAGVPGGLLVLDAASHPDSSPADLAELHSIVDSITIELLPGS